MAGTCKEWTFSCLPVVPLISKYMEIQRRAMLFISEFAILSRCTAQQRQWQKNTVGLHCWISHGTEGF